MGYFLLKLRLLIEILFHKALLSKLRFLQALYLDRFQEFCERLDGICGAALMWFLRDVSVLPIRVTWDTDP